jgi:hypothetical protein
MGLTSAPYLGYSIRSITHHSPALRRRRIFSNAKRDRGAMNQPPEDPRELLRRRKLSDQVYHFQLIVIVGLLLSCYIAALAKFGG